MKIDTERLILRDLSLDDAADMFAYTSRPSVSRFLTWEPHTSVEQDYRFIEKALEVNGCGEYYAGIELKKDKKLIGCIHVYNLSSRHRRCEISYILNPDYSGAGYAAEAVNAISEWLMKEMNFVRIQALCVTDNDRSEKLLKRCNMSCEGTLRNYAVLKDGKSYPMKIYSKCRED